MVKRRLVKMALWVASIILLPLVVLRWLWSLKDVFSDLRASEVIFIYTHAVNYGLNLIFVDAIRRILSGKNITVVLVWEPEGSQNRKLGKIFTDISVRFLRSPFFIFPLFGKPFCLPEKTMGEPVLDKVTYWLFRILIPGVEQRTIESVYHNLPIPVELSDVVPQDYMNYKDAPVPRQIYAHTLWGFFVAKPPPSPLPVMPEPWKSDIHEKLLRARGGRAAKLCMMHNRVETHPDPDSKLLRDGSPVEAYLPALGLLVDYGYQVIVCGDRTLTTEQFDGFSGMVVDAPRLGIDLDLLRLFAPIEADIVIGDGQSGIILPIIMGKPSITFNAFGVFTIPGRWVYPKHVTNSDGIPVAYSDVLKTDAYCEFFVGNAPQNGFVYHHNTSEEILDGVSCFLDDLDEGGSVGNVEDPEKKILNEVPLLSLYHVFGTRFSSAFIRRDQASQESAGSGTATLNG